MTVEYVTVSGTEPTQTAPHEPRTMKRLLGTQVTHMLTEIEDGTLVGWDMCGKCSAHVSQCKCSGGPVTPTHIADWRDKRFENSLRGRGVAPVDDTIVDPDDTSGTSDDPDYGGHVEPVSPETNDRSNVDAGLEAALERLRRAKESGDQVDF